MFGLQGAVGKAAVDSGCKSLLLSRGGISGQHALPASCVVGSRGSISCAPALGPRRSVGCGLGLCPACGSRTYCSFSEEGSPRSPTGRQGSGIPGCPNVMASGPHFYPNLRVTSMLLPCRRQGGAGELWGERLGASEVPGDSHVFHLGSKLTKD